MRDERPLLFLDVDGVISPVGSNPPPGFTRVAADDFSVVWNPAHRTSFAVLADLFEVVWATTWEHQANTAFSPRLGFPDLPVIEFSEQRKGDTWKLADIADYAGDRPAAWVDDSLFTDAFRWAETRVVTSTNTPPDSAQHTSERATGTAPGSFQEGPQGNQQARPDSPNACGRTASARKHESRLSTT